MTISADEAMRLAGDALVEAAHVSDEWGIDKYVTNGDDCAAAVIRALDAAGWQLVPKVATEEMEECGWIDKEDVTPSEIYGRMLDAAPKMVQVKP